MTAYSPKQNAERLLQLSNEVSRIAGALAQLSSHPDAVPKAEHRPSTNLPDISADKVMRVIRTRRLRAQYFPEDLFADPAWDMMLDLFHAELMHRRVSVSSLCVAAEVPATTALRWLTNMVERNLFVRRSDPLDGRRIFVELAPELSHAMRRYFAEAADLA
jgi:DNA-binding MarR family transcriptional regulator